MDWSSSANSNDVTIDHISIKWHIDFAENRVRGTAKLFAAIAKSTDLIILDGRLLHIASVTVNNASAIFKVEDADVLGQKITVAIGKHAAGDNVELEFEYSTGDGCTALQFMKAEQTADKKKPFLFSQCQAIHARSIVPCMDTPAVKQTYDAQVTVPEGMVCLMSAIGIGEPEEANGTLKYSFKQSVRIPSYLLAIVVGLLEKREISDRSVVWAEPSVVDKAHYEFADTEKMLRTAESLAGKYIWGRYDLVVLSPSFPFGGMENPCLTFVTPTLLAGDRSLANVIAHEISHSWTGNLVTNANWEHFWLNEGFTTFLERKIVGRLEGEEQRQFEAQDGWEDHLVSAVKEQYSDSHPFTKLIPELQRVDPDDAFSSVPYEKGSALLMYIEQQLNDSHAFEEFLQSYIKKFAQKSIVTSDWKNYLYDYFGDKKAVLDGINWDNWFYGTGMPSSKPTFDGRLMLEAHTLAEQWINTSDANLKSIDGAKYSSLSTRQKIKVLEYLRASQTPFSSSKLKRLDEVNKFSSSGNCEILFKWIRMGLSFYWEDIIPLAFNFVTRQGRIKYVRPIYKELFNWTESAGKAIVMFGKNAPFMHPITVSIVNKLIPK